jgi:hypothetical protein
MPDQALARRQTTVPTVVQHHQQSVALRHTNAQVTKAENLTSAMLVAKDRYYQRLEAYVGKGGRSYHHQRYIEGQATDLLQKHDVALDEMYRREMRRIVDNQPTERVLVPTPYYVEVRPRGLIGKLFKS